MPIISSYPLKQGPLDSKDEIIISDAEASDPKFKTKNTNLKAISSFNNVNFDFTQGVPSATWNIQHSLDKYPSVSVVCNVCLSVDDCIRCIYVFITAQGSGDFYFIKKY